MVKLSGLPTGRFDRNCKLFGLDRATVIDLFCFEIWGEDKFLWDYKSELLNNCLYWFGADCFSQTSKIHDEVRKIVFEVRKSYAR